MHKFFLTLGLLLCSGVAWGQYNSNFQIEYFFGRLPSARAEAMGGIDVAFGGSVLSTFMNPASIGQVQDWEFDASTAAPYFLLREADYYFVGGAYRLSDKLVVAVSGHQFAMGVTDFEINLGLQRYTVDLPKTNNARVSAAYQVLPGLYVGANVGLLGWKYINDLRRTRALNVDLGAQYQRALSEKLTLMGGLSVTNVSGTGIKFKDPADFVYQQDFPTALRVGGALKGTETLSVGGEDIPVGWLVSAHFQDLLNSSFRTGLSFGAETSLWQVIVLRLGYYNVSKDQLGRPDVNFPRWKSWTYGFGIIVPTQALFQDKLPFDTYIDFTSIPHPEVSSLNTGRLPNFRSFAMRLVWNVE